jgi:hypothetical protein
MPFPFTPILDNFNRANETPLSNSGQWTQHLFSSLNQINLSSNVCLSINASLVDCYWNPQTFGPDCECYMTIPTLPGNGAAMRLYLRCVNPGASINGYACIYNMVSGTDNVNFYRIDSGVLTGLGSISQNFSAGDRLGFSMVGSLMTIYRAAAATPNTWVSLGTHTDTTYTAAGFIGFGISGTVGRVDDFGGGASGYSDASIIATTTFLNSVDFSSFVDSTTIATVTSLPYTEGTIYIEEGPVDFDTTVYPSDNNKVINNASSLLKYAQGFTPGNNGLMRGGSIIVTRRGTPTDTLTVELQSNSAGSPSGTVLASVTLDLSALVANVETEVFFSFPSVVSLSGGTEYYFVTYRTGSSDAVNYWELGFSTNSALTQSKVFN